MTEGTKVDLVDLVDYVDKVDSPRQVDAISAWQDEGVALIISPLRLVPAVYHMVNRISESEL